MAEVPDINRARWVRILAAGPGGTTVVDPTSGGGGGGSTMDLRGLIADRPAAGEVEVGTTYWAVDRVGEANEVSVSNGSAWTNI